MPKEPVEFIDRDHPVAENFYKIVDSYTGRNLKTMRNKINKLIEKDPDFLDTYGLLSEIELKDMHIIKYVRLLEGAYKRAIAMITDKDDNWPDVMEWAWMENRHVIRAILNWAIAIWREGNLDEALDIFRKLLRSNPGDNAGARHYILAILMKMSFDNFDKKFDRGGYYDQEIMDWFDKHCKEFPDDFDWWDKWCDENL
ncbi:MAG: hypothetical protein P9X24_09010 [Candidatus Hatepunaea meridiana]|nr:hypothetical protein [Candidatus Hatepunaea meridiana]